MWGWLGVGSIFQGGFGSLLRHFPTVHMVLQFGVCILFGAFRISYNYPKIFLCFFHSCDRSLRLKFNNFWINLREKVLARF